MTSKNATAPMRRWTADELRRLPPDECDAILAQAAELAAAEYENDRQLTDFEAFGESDLYGDSSDSTPG